MKKRDYVVSAYCDGILKHYTMHSVSDKKKEVIAENIGRDLFYADVVSVISILETI